MISLQPVPRQLLIIGAASLLCLSAYLAYFPALSAGFIWDDLTLVTSRALSDSYSGLKTIWLYPAAVPSEEHYWPVVYTAFWLQAQVWGGFHDASGYHLVNVAGHAVNCGLIWALLRCVGMKEPGPWAAAVLFALHPVHVESVAWVIELKDILSGFFYLGAAIAFFRFRECSGSGRIAWYATTVLLFAAGMLTKSIVVTLPAALLIAVWWRTGHLALRDAAAVAPLFALGATLVVLDVLIAEGAGTAAFDLSYAERIQAAGMSAWFYLGKLILPARLMPIYPRWQLDIGDPLRYLPFAASIASLAALWALRRRIGRGPLAAALFYAVTLSPVLGFVRFSYMQHSFVADRYQYLASLGPLALAGGVWAWADRRTARRGAKAAWRAGFGALALALAALTWNQSTLWQTPEKLFARNIRLNPNAWLAHQMLARAYAAKGDLPRARVHLAKTLELQPDDNMNRRNLAAVLIQLGEPRLALNYIEEAMRRDPRDSRASTLRIAALNALQDEKKASP